jgi:hypothetical protein
MKGLNGRLFVSATLKGNGRLWGVRRMLNYRLDHICYNQNDSKSGNEALLMSKITITKENLMNCILKTKELEQLHNV